MAESAVESAPGDENDDSWLYGDSVNEQVGDKAEGEPNKEPLVPGSGDAAPVCY